MLQKFVRAELIPPSLERGGGSRSSTLSLTRLLLVFRNLSFEADNLAGLEQLVLLVVAAVARILYGRVQE